ncbi:hypothetical protein ACWV26_18005 [Rummeliibacillus sp. JY-2-4R]
MVTKKREFILENYPIVSTGIKQFENIVIKSFDWENYIYKCVLAAEYIEYLDIMEDNYNKQIIAYARFLCKGQYFNTE